MLHKIPALAALGNNDLDLAAALGAERLGEQVALLEFVRHQHQPRRRLVVVELRHERAEHLGRAEGAISFREISAVAPILSGAEKEHLDAIVAAGLMQREYVGFLYGAWIDALMRRDCR